MSLEFDGIVDYVKFPNNTIPANLGIVNPKYTLLCWCYATDLTGNDKYLISFQYEDDAQTGQSIVLKGASDATAGRIGFWHARGGSDGFPPDNYFRVDVKVTENNWHLVALRGTVSNIIKKISHTSSNSLPFSITTSSSATNRLLIFFFCNESPNDLSAVSSVTYGGQNMTFVDFVEVDEGMNARIEVWMLKEVGIAAAVGTSFSVVFPGGGGTNDTGYSAISLYNVDQNDPIPSGNIKKNTSTSTAAEISAGNVNANGDDAIISCTIVGNNRTFTAGPDMTKLTDQQHAGFDTSASHMMQYNRIFVTNPSDTTDIRSTVVGSVNRQAIIAFSVNNDGVAGEIDVSVDGGSWTNSQTGAFDQLFTSTGIQWNYYIGRKSKNTSTEYFKGKIADVRAYDRYLTQNELATIYSSKGKDSIVRGLLGRWPMNDSAIGTIPGNGTSSFVDSEETLTNNVTSFNATIPDNVDGDLLIAVLCFSGRSGNGGNGPNVTFAPSGWNLIAENDIPGGAPSCPSLWVYYKTASSDSGTASWSIDQQCHMIGHLLSYRSIPNHVPNVISSLNGAGSGTMTSPAIAGTDAVLALRFLGIDATGPMPTPNSNIYPSSTTGRHSTESAPTTPNNGCVLATVDELNVTSVPIRTWNPAATTHEWGSHTITWLTQSETAGNIDISGAVGHPHNGAVQGYSKTQESELRI